MSSPSAEEFKERLGKLLVKWRDWSKYLFPTANSKIVGFLRVVDPYGGSSG